MFSDIIIVLSDRAPVEMLRAHTQVHRHQNSAAPLHIHISTCMQFNYAFFRLGHPLRRRRDRGTAPDLCPSVCMVAATLPRRADRQSVGGARMYALHAPPACNGAGPSVLPSGALGTSRRAWRGPALKGRDARQIGGGLYGMPVCR